MNNAKWTIFAVAYQCVFAYVIAFMIFQFATFFTTGVFGIGLIIALLFLLVMLYLLFRPAPGAGKKAETAAAGI